LPPPRSLLVTSVLWGVFILNRVFIDAVVHEFPGVGLLSQVKNKASMIHSFPANRSGLGNSDTSTAARSLPVLHLLLG
jgi:hypothetical protein